jgi:hypothetical protein
MISSEVSTEHNVCTQAAAKLDLLLPELSEAQRGLDVVLLHRVILEKGLGITAEEAEKFIAYEREMEKAIGAVDRGEAQMACLLKPCAWTGDGDCPGGRRAAAQVHGFLCKAAERRDDCRAARR